VVLFITGVAWAWVTYEAYAQASVKFSEIKGTFNQQSQAWDLYASSSHWGNILNETLAGAPDDDAITGKLYYGLAWFRDDGGNIEPEEYTYGSDVDWTAVANENWGNSGSQTYSNPGVNLLNNGNSYEWSGLTRYSSLSGVDNRTNYWAGAYTTVGYRKGANNSGFNPDYQMKAMTYMWAPNGTLYNVGYNYMAQTIGE